MVTPHPLVRVRVEVDGSSYSSRNFVANPNRELALANSRAQLVVMGPKHAALLGVKETQYLPAKKTIQVADNRTPRVLGTAILEMTIVGTNRTTRKQAYFMEAGDQLYLSLKTFWDLGRLLEN